MTPGDKNGFGLSASGESTPETGLSLDQLNAAFAQMLGKGHDPYEAIEPAPGQNPPTLGSPVETWTDPDVAARRDLSPLRIVEAMLFVGSPDNEPLGADKIAGLMRGVRPPEVVELIDRLNAQYRANGCPYEIASAGAGYRMTLLPAFEAVRERCFQRNRRVKLSPAAVEVLSLVAYHQPVATAQVDRLRGRTSSALLRQLVRRQLIAMERQHGKAIYSTTDRFLELFGLEAIDDLPRDEDLDNR